MGDVEGVLGGEGGFGEREQVDSVQDVGLALAVESHEAVEFGRKLKSGIADVAIIQYVERL